MASFANPLESSEFLIGDKIICGGGGGVEQFREGDGTTQTHNVKLPSETYITKKKTARGQYSALDLKTQKKDLNTASELDKIYQFSLAIYVLQTNMKL